MMMCLVTWQRTEPSYPVAFEPVSSWH